MQLDQTRIVIRERRFGEILGLALQVTRAGIHWIAPLWLLGVSAFAVLNGFLLYPTLVDDLDFEEVPVRYGILLLILVAIETPLATAPITLYLGKMTFNSPFQFRTMLVELIRSLPQLLLYQVVLRTLLMPFLLLPYWLMPYLGELILLERNPLTGGRHQRLTTNRRSRNLHSNNGAELFGRWVTAVIVGGALTLALGFGIAILVTQIGGIEVTPLIQFLVVGPLSLWVVVGWMAVVRFLSYLDLRIRREGWEVELLMRAEASRLRRPSSLVSA
ncbi:hypothetical protein NG895_13925 [Aeoliella sp. ICT_H6.2]|uniref:Uncharacterized protein n=1 Tax=Aeoliella straminimaris TaxID=2954799 RepID=A0A9X2FB59_9BACT|nr:hypothetical protein [Aeoliella straminimaris]MCO6045003.1 hypothetical protein [Aeoliella straminimaris]